MNSKLALEKIVNVNFINVLSFVLFYISRYLENYLLFNLSFGLFVISFIYGGIIFYTIFNHKTEIENYKKYYYKILRASIHSSFFIFFGILTYLGITPF